jgi:hypothetical protein
MPQAKADSRHDGHRAPGLARQGVWLEISSPPRKKFIQTHAKYVRNLDA